MNKRSVFSMLQIVVITAFIILLTIGLAQAQTASGPLNGSGGVTAVPDSPAAVSAFSDPVDCGLLVSPVIGYDISRGQAASDVNGLFTDLESLGYHIGTVNIKTDPIPACVDILIVRGLAGNSVLSSAYTASEATMLHTWTASGHGLLLASDWGLFKDNTQALFQAYGYSLVGGTAVADPTDFDPAGLNNAWVIYQADNFAAHPILSGVSSLEFLYSSSITPGANAVVTTDSDAVPAQTPVMAAFLDSQGCVILAADSNWFADFDGGYGKVNNAQAARQTMDWLLTCNQLSLTKTASANLVAPGGWVTYTMTAVNGYTTALTGLVITDTLPAGTTFASATGPYTGPDGQNVITWNLGTLGVNNSTGVKMAVRLNDNLIGGTVVANTAYVSSHEGLHDSATALVTVDAPISASLYLPFISNKVCRAAPSGADVVLLMDTSSSMNQPAEGGGTRLNAAVTAASTFIDLLHFPDDQAGIVSFAGKATLQSPLSTDAASLQAVLQTLTAGGITRIDLALAAGRAELTSPRHKPANKPVLILLTDGKPNGTTAEAVMSEAAAAKASGITIYTIGLGADVDAGLLQAVATSPADYYQAPTTADLNKIYQEIAGQLHCN